MAKKIKKPETFLEFCDLISPCLARAMAMIPRSDIAKRGRYRLMSHTEIAERSGLPPRTVQRIASAKSWDGIKLGTASKFLAGCGVDIVKRDWLAGFIEKYADANFDYMSTKQKNYFFTLMGWKVPPEAK